MSTFKRTGLFKPSAIATGLIVGLSMLFAQPAAAQHQQCWEPLIDPSGRNGTSNIVRAITTFDDGTGPALYVGGWFGIAGNEQASRIAKWDGVTWSSLDSGTNYSGVNSDVYAMTVFDDGTGPALYVGGSFTTAGGINPSTPGVVRVNGIAKWNGTAWSALEGPSEIGVSGMVYALTVFDDGSGPALYAAGRFTTAGGVTVNRVAKWDGTTWSALEGPTGIGVSGEVRALTVYDDGSGSSLYVGGSFATAGGVPVNTIAKWDGASWSALVGPSGNRPSGPIQTLAVFDDGNGPELYTGSATTGSNRIAKWNGTDWTILQGPISSSTAAQFWAMTVFDDGTGDGPCLYVGGTFQCISGKKTLGIAKWDGSTWHSYRPPRSQGGASIWIKALGVFDNGQGDPPQLFAGGMFTRAGGVPASYIAKWQVCQQPPCPCDYNEDGQQTVNDYLDFLTDFFTQLGFIQGTADFDNDCAITISDYFQFLNCLPAIAASEPCPE